jgi:hypothetical protein
MALTPRIATDEVLYSIVEKHPGEPASLIAEFLGRYFFRKEDQRALEKEFQARFPEHVQLLEALMNEYDAEFAMGVDDGLAAYPPRQATKKYLAGYVLGRNSR